MLSFNRLGLDRLVKRPVTIFFSAIAVSASLLLAGCGGGGSIEVGSEQSVDFDLILSVNNQPINAVNVLPGEVQDVDIPVGSNFEIASSGPVAWTVVTGGVIVNPPVNGTLVYQGINMTPKFISNARYAANTQRAGTMLGPVVVSFIATSLNDSRQVGQINLAVY